MTATTTQANQTDRHAHARTGSSGCALPSEKAPGHDVR